MLYDKIWNVSSDSKWKWGEKIPVVWEKKKSCLVFSQIDGSKYLHFLTSAQLNCGSAKNLQAISPHNYPGGSAFGLDCSSGGAFWLPSTQTPVNPKTKPVPQSVHQGILHVRPLANRATSIGSDTTFKKSSLWSIHNLDSTSFDPVMTISSHRIRR